MQANRLAERIALGSHSTVDAGPHPAVPAARGFLFSRNRHVRASRATESADGRGYYHGGINA